MKKIIAGLSSLFMMMPSASFLAKGDSPTEHSVPIEYKLMEKMPKESDYMFSPLSIKLAFLLAANGSQGETQKEICETFDIPDIDQYNKKVRGIIDSYQEHNLVNIANSVWFNTHEEPPSLEEEIARFLRRRRHVGLWDEWCPYDDREDVCFIDLIALFNLNFLENIRNNLFAESYTVTDKNAVQQINDWVKEKTHGKIDSIISDSNFRTALVNAIYFKGEWESPFKKDKTTPMDFTCQNGNIKKLDFMNQRNFFNYFENDNLQLVEMKYKNSDLSMYIALPKKNNEITYEDLNQAMSNKSQRLVDIKMPKFKTDTSLELSKDMIDLGIKTAFDDQKADFSPMFDDSLKEQGCYISKVLHKSFIEVEESGTEAAAVTAIACRTNSIGNEPFCYSFNANHPFTYIIMDNSNNEILFMGKQAFFK